MAPGRSPTPASSTGDTPVPDWLINLCNRVNDADVTWVGFRSLRPAPSAPMTARVVAWLCVVYCPLSAAAGYCITYLVMSMRAGQRPPAVLPWIIAGGAAALFMIMQTLLAVAWNARAVR